MDEIAGLRELIEKQSKEIERLKSEMRIGMEFLAKALEAISNIEEKKNE